MAFQRLLLLSHMDVSATLSCGGFDLARKRPKSSFRESGQHLKKVIKKRNHGDTQEARYPLQVVPKKRSTSTEKAWHGGLVIRYVRIRRRQSWLLQKQEGEGGRTSLFVGNFVKKFWHSKMRERSIQKRSHGPIGE